MQVCVYRANFDWLPMTMDESNKIYTQYIQTVLINIVQAEELSVIIIGDEEWDMTEVHEPLNLLCTVWQILTRKPTEWTIEV